ncbi:hypothetical protein QUF76_16655 [Desulfobacterales bacterium HSG16]|nr:hypothetical protein [Desulfobacterales bacterium HSG16]
MKILKIEYLIRAGKFGESREFEEIIDDVKKAILSVTWPPESSSFILYPEKKANGVVPIKKNCMEYLKQQGWKLEHPMLIASRKKPGKVDAIKKLEDDRYSAVEWETGNISSSHRALNKIAVGMLDGILAGGILILPSRGMYQFLTDRVGNYPEIEPYFPLWRSLSIDKGVLAVIEIEHDGLSHDVPPIKKGTDGRAKR